MSLWKVFAIAAIIAKPRLSMSPKHNEKCLKLLSILLQKMYKIM